MGALLFVFAAFVTLTLSQSASVSSGTEATVKTNGTDVTTESVSVGELRFGPGAARPCPVMRERAPAVCRARYLYHPEKADWEGAKMLCEMEGGQLAVITSEAEQGRIASRFGRLPEFWVGCTDIEREGQFRWVNGQGWICSLVQDSAYEEIPEQRTLRHFQLLGQRRQM